ncbi:hypothetical protein CMO90_04510 [Candidatus Woesearchaeota archaeon]|mgnify:CR=1 FL=1|jgi:hypothetical protein|nr:hypothetical protein [Candidatus Woesearchaeota archaeon]|tara:strand:+ start:2698 stop:3129 length:432 start_codon:yes stop_codon:yes gene_type:complete
MPKKVNRRKKAKKSVSKLKTRKELLSKKEQKFFGYYVLAGIVLALLLLLIFKISIASTFSKFYGLLYMFFVPGLFIFRAFYKHKIFKTDWEEYGYPALISWVLHSLLIAGISGFFKTPITDLNLYGGSFVLIIISVIVFYVRK